MFHFWIFIVGAPLLLRLWMGLTFNKAAFEQQKEQVSNELAQQGQHNLEFLDRYLEDPARSCQDHVLCLTELWCSAVMGMACMGNALPSSWKLPLRLATRLAAFVSLQQFQKLWFLLKRQNQPNPKTKWTFTFLALCNLRGTAWFVALEMAELLYNQPWALILSVYGSLWAGFAATTRQWSPPQRKPEEEAYVQVQEEPKTPETRIRKRGIIASSFVLLILLLAKRNMNAISQSTMLLQSSNSLSMGRKILGYFAGALAATPLVWHTASFARILKIEYTNDLPLNMDPKEFARKFEEPSRNEWRFRINWREPQRVAVVLDEWLDEWYGRVLYSLIVHASVEERIRQETQPWRDDPVRKRGVHIFQRLEYDMKNSRRSKTPLSKETVMEHVKRQHAKRFDMGIVDDPIGQALYKTFNIGLGFEFEPFLNATDAEKNPTSRHLQVKAAKSAIRRAQTLYKKGLEETFLERFQDDPEIREQKWDHFNESRKKEMTFMAERLTELIPTEFDLMSLDYESDKFKIPRSALDGESYSPVIEALLRESRNQTAADEIDYLNPFCSAEPTTPLDPAPKPDTHPAYLLGDDEDIQYC